MIQSDYTTERFFVLTNDENKIMAIIKCEIGLTEITETVEQAICADEDLYMASISTDIVMAENGERYRITAKVSETDDEYDEEYKDYFLTNVEMY